MKNGDICWVEFGKQEHSDPRKIITTDSWQMEYVVRDTRLEPPSEANQKGAVTFALHGFARPLEDMLAWSAHWSQPGLFISLHLPHHGKSCPIQGQVPMDHPLTVEDLFAILKQIAEKEGGAPIGWNLIGYSIGGRVALSLFHHRPQQWNRILLLAPDGLKKSPFYQVTVHTKIGKWAWLTVDRNAQNVLKFLNALGRTGLITKHLQSFCEFHLVSHEMRMMVWHGWRSHRALWPTTAQLGSAMASWSGTMDLCFGDRDLIIPFENSRKLQRILKPSSHIRFHIIPSGHGMLREEVILEVNRRILTP